MWRRTIATVVTVLLTWSSGLAQDRIPTPFQLVNGDGWITSNAHFDGTAWTSRLEARPSFGLQLGEENDIPFEHGTAGATFWTRDQNCHGPFEAFGEACGWQLALAITQFRSLVVGGNGIEIDGLNLKAPYGRILSASDGTARRFGLTDNVYADWSGADVATDPRWFAGFDLTNDRFEIARGMSMSLTPLASVDRDGRFSAASVATARVVQSAPAAFATRAHLSGGTFVFAFPHPYAHVPVCVASSEGTAPVHVRSGISSCAVISADGADASMINVQVTGDPD